MILSHKYKYIFIKSFKTSSSSLEVALSQFCGDQDIITPLGYDEKIRSNDKKFKNPQNHNKTTKFWDHMSASEIREKINHKIWNEYFKFVVVRNPFEQIQSAYYWHNMIKQKSKKFFLFKKKK